MAGTVDGTFRGDATLAKANKAKQDEIDQLRRRLSKRPEVPATGSIEGQVDLTSTNGTVRALSGENSLRYTEVTYQTPYDPEAATDGGPSWLTVDGYQIIPTEGWYSVVARVRLTWGSEADAPESFGIYMGGGYDTPHQDYPIRARSRLGLSTWGVNEYVDLGMTYFHAATGEDFHVECRFPIDATADSVAGDVGLTLTKWA